MQQTQDTEITLGTGKLLGIFFSLAILCGVFFTLGYMLGRSSAPSGATTEIVGSVPGGNPANKPAAGNKSGETITQNCPPGSPNCASGSGIAIKTPDVQLQASDPASSQPPSGGDAAASSTNAAPELRNGAGGSFMVQVAAVSKKEDADILVAALQKKQYPVFVANAQGDALFHVQVGPFTDVKDAESMRSRLVGDGYNAILKK